MVLRPEPDLSAAEWLVDTDQPWPELVSFGPRGFPAYARLRFIPDPAHEGQRENDVVLDEDIPSETARLRVVLETLARHTSTPDDCYFCLWDGWSSDIEGGDTLLIDQRTGSIRKGRTIAPAFPPEVLHGPKVVVPNRAYYLFRGTLSDFGDWDAAEMWPGQPRGRMPDPAFIWPADHAWSIADDVDPHWAGIGASELAISELVADRRIDAVPADPQERPPSYG